MISMLLREDVTLATALGAGMRGDVVYEPDFHALVLVAPDGEEEVLSLRIPGAETPADPWETFIKDWTEHEGLTSSLVEAGLVEILGTETVGPFGSRAYRVRVLEG